MTSESEREIERKKREMKRRIKIRIDISDDPGRSESSDKFRRKCWLDKDRAN